MNPRHPTDGDAAFRRAALAELRRSRRHLLALLEGFSEEEGAWVQELRSLSCAKWHAGHVALCERLQLAQQVGGIGRSLSAEDGTFGVASRHDRSARHPSWRTIRASLARIRRLTEALLENSTERCEVEDIVRAIVNEEHAQARFIRQIRRELGKPDVAEPSSPLLQIDTDVEAPPLYRIASWTPPRRRGERPPAHVASLSEHRDRRARETLELGHRLVGAGDYRGALRAFEESASLQTSADALTYQGWMHSLLGDDERAERLCKEAIAIDPDFGNPYNDIGTFCLRRRDVHAAIDWFERAKKAKRYEPRHFPFINLGKLYASLGLPHEALREFEAALSFAPGNPEVQQAIDHLRRHIEEKSSR